MSRTYATETSLCSRCGNVLRKGAKASRWNRQWIHAGCRTASGLKKATAVADRNAEYARIMAARGEPLKPLSTPKPKKKVKVNAKGRPSQPKARKRRQPTVTVRHVDPAVRPKRIYTTPQGKAYEAYINSQEWADKRTLYWRTNGYSCKATGCSRNKNLHVHHHTYERLGNERLSDLLGLCIPHHDEVHAFHKKNPRMTLAEATAKVTGVAL